MKALIVIWAAALVSGVGTVGYISHGIDQLIVKQTECTIQCPNVDLQPAKNVVQVTSNAPLQATADYELQPALGYKALNWDVEKLEVR
ncbi:hypothetical protein [Caudoviricetes sp.]|nr:hypothetical protein [Caudoviricetes sp.]